MTSAADGPRPIKDRSGSQKALAGIVTLAIITLPVFGWFGIAELTCWSGFFAESFCGEWSGRYVAGPAIMLCLLGLVHGAAFCIGAGGRMLYDKVLTEVTKRW